MAREFDLEKRTTEFAKAVIKVCKRLPRNSMNERLVGQVVGSAGSVGANYRETNDSVGDKDFILRMKIARREAKESQHWLELILEANDSNEADIEPLIKESIELIKICHQLLLSYRRESLRKLSWFLYLGHCIFS